MKTSKKKSVKIDFGYYEKRLCVLIMISTITNSLSTFQFLVTQYTPPFHCDVGSIYNKTGRNASAVGFLNLTIPYEKDSDNKLVRSSCSYYNISLNGSSSTNYSNNQILKCSKFKLYGSEVTATMELKMVCDKEYIDPLMPSLYMAGKLVGGLIGGLISDQFGRRPCFLIFTLYQHVLTIMQSFTSEPISYGIIMFFNGFGSLVNYMAITIIGIECLPSRLRHYVLFLNTIGYAIGYMLVPLLGWYITSWRWYLRVSGMVGVIYIPYYWYIDETLIWLISKNKNEEAKELMKKIGKLNGQHLEISDTHDNLLSTSTNERLGITKSWIALFKTWKLLYRIMIVSFSWFMTSAIYYSISYSTNHLSGDRFLNMFYSSLMELASAFVYFFVTAKLEQRNTFIVFMALTGVCVIFSPIIRSWNMNVSIVVFMVGKLTAAVLFSVIYSYTGEIVPTSIRHSVVAVSSMCSRFGGILAPYLIYIGQNGGEATSTLIIGIMALLSATLYVKLPNTRNLPLPKTIMEAKQMNKGVLFTCAGDEDFGDTENLEGDKSVSKFEMSL